MSEPAITVSDPTAAPETEPVVVAPAKSFLSHAKLIGEAVIAAFIFGSSGDRPDRVLMLKFAAIMLPYVMFVCGGAFLSAILQVHKRFGPPAFAPILLNGCHIAVVSGGAW